MPDDRSLPNLHLDDATLSELVDDAVALDQSATARQHLDACSTCRAQLQLTAHVKTALRGLPDLDAQRDFALGPRAVARTQTIQRLRVSYRAAQAATASLAAVFVALLAIQVFLQTTPPSASETSRVPSPAAATIPSPAAAAAPAVAPRAALAPAAPAVPQATALAPTPVVSSEPSRPLGGPVLPQTLAALLFAAALVSTLVLRHRLRSATATFEPPT